MIDKTPKFAEDFTKWALKVTVDTSDCPNWLAGDCRMVTCDCFPRFIQLFLNVLHYAVLTYADGKVLFWILKFFKYKNQFPKCEFIVGELNSPYIKMSIALTCLESFSGTNSSFSETFRWCSSG